MNPKSKILTIVLFVALLAPIAGIPILFSGCQTAQPESVQMITQLAVSTGASLWLRDHPDDRPKFVEAEVALKVIVDAGQGTPDQLAAALAKMPITVATLPAPKSVGKVTVAAKVVKVHSANGAQVATTDPNNAVNDWVLPIARGSYQGLVSVLGS